MLMFPEVEILLHGPDVKRKRRIATEMSSACLRTQPSLSLHPEQGLGGKSNTNGTPGPTLGVRVETPRIFQNSTMLQDIFTGPENNFSCKLKSNFTTRRKEN